MRGRGLVLPEVLAVEVSGMSVVAAVTSVAGVGSGGTCLASADAPDVAWRLQMAGSIPANINHQCTRLLWQLAQAHTIG